MIVRIWTTRVEPTRVDEYRSFAIERSLPMFREQDGFLGVMFTESELRFAVISLWTDRRAAEALESSASYRATVAAITRAGFLTGSQGVEILDVKGGHVDVAVAGVLSKS